MNRQQAIQLIQQTFEAPFDRERYIRFLRELLNGFDSDGARVNHGARIPEKFQDYVEKMERVGKYGTDGKEILLFIVYLKRETSIERARTMQRNFVAWYLQRDMKDATLVAFVSPNLEDWRFSLVKMEYRLEDGAKVREEFTPARRWSFLVGVHEKSHTAQSKFVPILEDDQNPPTLAQLEEAFNIEKVTKEFFEKYRDLFVRTKEALDQAVEANPAARSDFEAKGVDTVNLAKKLLGQIVFLYYLQKKGWFGVPRDAAWGAGSKNFLRELFEKKHGAYNNFFNDVLEPLFYEALRIDRSHDDHYYSRFNCKITFLNGGLFDPLNNYDWVRTDIFLPDSLFSNKNKTKEGDVGDGILDVFDRYNFTVKEDEPFEKEVAIDPELLGKAYEKFNAIRPDNYAEYLQALKSGKKGEESKFNKQYGVYYTPREIVHYMCQQSLIQYLHSELNVTASREAVKQSPVSEEIASTPAGSRNDMVSKEDIETLILRGEQIREHDEQVMAAGRETETYSFQMPESIRKHAARLDRALAEIKVCDPAAGSGAFPVGMMNEIVKARLALSTYLPSPEGRGDGGEGASAYRFKRACIENSLYGVDIDPGAVEIAKLRLWLSLVVDEDDPQNIQPLPNLDYKIVQGNSLIEILTEDFLAADSDAQRTQLLKQLKAAKDKLFNTTSPAQKERLRREIDGLMNALFENYRDRQIRKLEEQLQGLKGAVQFAGFSTEKISKSDAEKIRNIEDQMKALRDLRLPDKTGHFEWHIYFSEVFEKGGFDVVIANPPYIDSERMSDGQFADIRAIVAKTYKLTKGNWDIYIAFFEKGFNLLNLKGALTFITPDKWISKPFGDALRISKVHNLLAILKAGRNVFEDAKVDAIVTVFTNQIQENIFVYIYQTEIMLKDRIQKHRLKSPYRLDELFSSSLDLIQKIDSLEVRLSDEFLCENACATSDAYKLKPFISDSKASDVNITSYFKVANTGTIGKYFSRWGIQPMVYLGDEYLRPVVKRTEFFKHFKNSYSKKTLRPKIIIKGLNLLDGFLDDDGTTIPGKTTLVITSKHDSKDDLKIMLALINSKVVFYYIKEKYSASSYNQGVTFTKEMLNSLPCPKIDTLKRKEIISLVDRILAAKRADPWADTSQWEREIDRLVYALYGLTEEEIAIVEGK